MQASQIHKQAWNNVRLYLQLQQKHFATIEQQNQVREKGGRRCRLQKKI